MLDFYQKRKIRTFVQSRITRVFLLFLVLLIGLSAFKRYQIAMEMADRRQDAESNLVHLREQKESLEAEVRYLSDERGIEAEMRRQFDVALEGEQVVVIVDPEISPVSPVSPVVVEEPAWYEFWR
jgi:cell division protein FtsB